VHIDDINDDGDDDYNSNNTFRKSGKFPKSLAGLAGFRVNDEAFKFIFD
jgi:hypothetical protein